MNGKKFIVCLKHGNKYSSKYVNTLFNMVKRNCTLDYEFICLTENPTDIDSEIRIEPLPDIPLEGWWYKLLCFDSKFKLDGTILFLDLDLIIFENIDKLFSYKPGKFCIIRDFNRFHIKNFQRVNSSVFRLQTGQYNIIYNEFMKNPALLNRKYRGDQEWIYHCIKNYNCEFEFWPFEWIQSYKWEMRQNSEMVRTSSGRNFKTPGTPIILPDTSIAVFHGTPNPDTCVDMWCSENWR